MDTPILKEECDKVGASLTSPPPTTLTLWTSSTLLCACLQNGSGDITWIEACLHDGAQGKPVLLATGASTIGDVQRAGGCHPGSEPAHGADAVQHQLHRLPTATSTISTSTCSQNLPPRCGRTSSWGLAITPAGMLPFLERLLWARAWWRRNTSPMIITGEVQTTPLQ